jgi:SAM-dependent methyltransferase
VDTEWDAAAVFDEDYLHFYEGLLSERSDAEAELIWSLGSLHPGDRVLDLACGHGRLSNRLAARGADVVGLDLTPLFLDRARQEAEALHLDVEYVQGDMRDLQWSGEFDLVVNWFTAFGYFGDETDRAILRGIHDALRPRGRLLLELLHGPALMRGFLPSMVTRRGEDAVVDEHRYDPMTGRTHVDRTVLRAGTIRTFHYSTRLFAFPELRDWLRAAGFAAVEGFGHDAEELTAEARRMVVRATRR